MPLTHRLVELDDRLGHTREISPSRRVLNEPGAVKELKVFVRSAVFASRRPGRRGRVEGPPEDHFIIDRIGEDFASDSAGRQSAAHAVDFPQFRTTKWLDCEKKVEKRMK